MFAVVIDLNQRLLALVAASDAVLIRHYSIACRIFCPDEMAHAGGELWFDPLSAFEA
jgi:hypothetical protein